MISSVDIAYYGVSLAKDWGYRDCGTWSPVIRAFSDFKAFLYILIGGF